MAKRTIVSCDLCNKDVLSVLTVSEALGEPPRQDMYHSEKPPETVDFCPSCLLHEFELVILKLDDRVRREYFRNLLRARLGN